ncbi:MAG: hypothetical protein WAP52_00365 [Candidatus Sungiibacteriota bacterium]
MTLFYSKEFVRMLERLPADICALFLRQEQILRENWRDSRLHLKQMKGKPITFSFRITRSYRAFFYFRTPDEATLYAVGHRKDIQRKLRT